MKGSLSRLLGFSVLLALAGCSNNTLTLQNNAPYPVTVTFRAQPYALDGASSSTPFKRVVNEIPNGSFDYSSIAQCPPSGSIYKGCAAGTGLGGNLSFSQGKTDILVMYTAYWDTTLVYTVNGVSSTTTSSTAPTQP
jgi:hypothetical protein